MTVNDKSSTWQRYLDICAKECIEDGNTTDKTDNGEEIRIEYRK